MNKFVCSLECTVNLYMFHWNKNLNWWLPGSEVINLFFMRNSAEHEIFPAHKC